MSETKELAAKTKQIKEYEERIKKYQDKKLLQQELRDKTRSLANDELGKNTELVKKAQDSYAKGKKATGSFQSIKNLRRFPANSMKGKPLKTRLVPGFTMQIFQS